MLSSMLLHMIEAARPIHTAFDRSHTKFLVNNVRNLLAIILHVQNVRFAQPAQIVGLSARRRIKRGAIQ
jgi:hypothetical protein